MSEKYSVCLNNHDVLKSLRERVKSKDHETNKLLKIITFVNDILYVWNDEVKCIDSIDIKQVMKGVDSKESVSLVPQPTLYYEVESMLVNSTSTIICMFGQHGISTVTLPDRWLSKDKKIPVNATYFCQRLFLGGNHVLRKVCWHPGSPTDSHIMLLTSDEKLRLYDVLNDNQVWEICIANHNYIKKSLSGKISLGETPVDFDIGSISEHNGDIYWPVYVVWGNGDVYTVNTTLDEFNTKVNGPIKITPAVNDNYGNDASSIIAMQTTPPLIVVATCNGLLNHFLLLNNETDQYLHAIERVEIELGLNLCENKDDDIVSCPIHLERDPNEVSRYFCIHNAGIHCVIVPFIQKLLDLSRNETSLFNPHKIQSSVDYLLCTSLNSDNTASYSPILGIAYLDLTKILVLLNNGKLIRITLTNQVDTSLFLADKVEKIVLEDNGDENFGLMINNILKENGVSSLPVIKLTGDVNRPQDWYELVTRSTQSFRLILKCHTEVALKIQQKNESLKTILNRQVDDVEKLNKNKSELRSTAEQIAEQYEEVNDKQNELIKRIESLLIKVDCSQKESYNSNKKKMIDLLEKAKTKLILLERDKDAVQSFYNTIESSTKTQRQLDEKDLKIDSKVQQLYKNLKFLTHEVGDLKERVISAQDTMSQLQFQDV